MSEALDKVYGVHELPLFPLPVVLFPGVPLPLHIFEPRYRQMLEDIRANNNLFGLSYFDSSASEDDVPPAGHIGCAAEVVEAQSLADGRSNILVIGLIRYEVERYIERGDSYLVGKVSFLEDIEEDKEELRARALVVSELFLRISRAVRIINDERAGLPDLPDAGPERLSFLVAATMEMDIEVKQELLELRSTSERLRRISDLLSQAVPSYEERARMHDISKRNGHSRKKIDLE